MRSDWSDEDLVGSWTLVDADLAADRRTSRPATRLGFALLLKFFELEARFPAGAEELPPAAVAYVAGQVRVDPADLSAYRWTGRTIEYHRAQVRDAFGFREFTRGDEDKLAAWLAEEVCPVELRDEHLHHALLVRCRSERIEPPGRSDRIVGAGRALFEKSFCELIVLRLGEQCTARLEELPTTEAGLSAALKADPGQV